MLEGDWQVLSPPDDFEKIRSDPRLVPLLILGRILNSMRFSQHVLADLGNREDALGRRQRVNAILHSGAMLYEGLKVTRALGKHFSHLDAFKRGFGELHADKAVTELQQTYLNRLRNKIVSHFDDDVVQEVLADLRLNEYVFVSAHGLEAGNQYYELSDEVVVHGLLQMPVRNQEFAQTLEEMFDRITELHVRFTTAADKLMPSALGELGWKLKRD